MSQSGRERNHLFLGQNGRRFVDLSRVSGLDHPGDARSFVLFDYDRDGWQDIAAINSNAPALLLYHNEIGQNRDGADGYFLGVRLVGGNSTAVASEEWSSRDGYGAGVAFGLEELTLRREHRAGEGLSAQNSATMLVGLGEEATARSLRVRWPSGREQETAEVPAGSLVTVYEDVSQSPSGEAFVVEPYVRTPDAPKVARPAAAAPMLPRLWNDSDTQPRLRVFTTLATWCPTCRTELPQYVRLREAFGSEAVGLYGVPIDPEDTADKLQRWTDTYEPAYAMLDTLAPDQLDAIRMLTRETFDAIPTTFVTDTDGRILVTTAGVPTVSDLKRQLSQLKR
ncbi:MAG: ASPIC/UnbV domain-containing protein [Vicinamibacterales bacterium]|nr:ASPIC/UnbV domain-containing protein [Vicinamibacterales bacterium]